MMKTTIKLLITAAIMMMMVQCEKEEVKKDNTETTAKTETVVLDVHNDLFSWRYYSLEENKEVSITNAADTLGWDLGIRYESFRTNGGKSGSAQGAIIDLGAVDFESVTIASIAGQTFTEDDSISVLASMAMPPSMIKTPGSLLLEDMFLSPQGPPPHTYTPNNHVYVIRTANGKHVKLIGTSFFNDLGVEGFFNFKFALLD